MIKYFCNKCGTELGKENMYRVDVSVKGFTRITDKFACDYCENCFAGILGAETFERLKFIGAERVKRMEERKAQKALEK